MRRSKLFARTNPLNSTSKEEIERLLELGVKVLMLPMFRSRNELADFVGLIDERAEIIPLVETLDAAESIEDIVKLDGIHEIHVGINDLSLNLGMRSRFMVFTTTLMGQIAKCTQTPGLRFGFGSIGQALDTSMPVPSDLIYAQYARLGGSAVIISQSFAASSLSNAQFDSSISKLRQRIAFWRSASTDRIERAHDELCDLLKPAGPGAR